MRCSPQRGLRAMASSFQVEAAPKASSAGILQRTGRFNGGIYYDHDVEWHLRGVST